MNLTLKRTRPLRDTGAAFAFGALLLQGCASVVARQPEVMEMQVGHAPAERAGEPERRSAGHNVLRVLLRRGQQGLKLSASGGLGLFQADSGEALSAIGAEAKGRLSAAGAALFLGAKNLGAKVEVRAENGRLRVAGRAYAGRLLLYAMGGQVLLINEVSLEDYLKGVLPGEVPSSWPIEALKAQAVAARSYAVWRVAETRKAGASPFDLDDSVSSQVYQGLQEHSERSDQAVDACADEVLSFQGKIAQCFFHSNSGGHTAGSDEAWGTAHAPAYLAGVDDPWSEDQKHYAWTASLPLAQVQAKLERAALWPGGLLQEVVPKDRSDSGRWLAVRLIGLKDEKLIKATALRTALGADVLRRTNFRARPRGDEVVFDGLGWGHGVGLAQEGAKAMAEAGKNYRAILAHYYPGTRWARLK